MGLLGLLALSGVHGGALLVIGGADRGERTPAGFAYSG